MTQPFPIKETALKALRLLWQFLLELFKIPIFAFKEIRVVRAQRMAYVLIILYPVMAMIAIALVISGTTGIDISLGKNPESQLVVGVFAPPGLSSTEIQQELKSFEYLQVKEFPDRASLMSALASSQVRVGIEVVPPENEYSFVQTRFYYDNSNFIASSSLVGQVRTAVQNIGLKKSGQMLGVLMSDINSIESVLSQQAQKTDELLIKLDEGDADILQLQEQLHNVGIGALQSKLEQFDLYYSQGKADINQTLSDTNEVRGKIQKYRTTVVNLRAQILGVSNSLDSILATLDASIAALQNGQNDAVVQQLQQIRATIAEQGSQLNQVDSQLAQAEADLDDTDAKLSAARERLKNADQKLDLAKGSIGEFEQTVSDLNTLIGRAETVIQNTMESKNLVKADLLSAKDLLGGIAAKMAELKKYSPEYLSNPIHVSIEPLYSFSRVTSVVPFTIAFVLLLTCLLLASTSMIYEQNWGILARMSASPTTLSSWMTGKVLGQTVIALFEAFLVFAVGIVLFGVLIPADLGQVFYAILISALCFIAIGIWITNSMKTASNCILTCLLFIVPMLFLSGILVPIEFMPPLLGELARILPLTASIDIIQGTYLRQAPLLSLWPSLLPLVLFAVICLFLSYWGRRQK